MAGRCCITGATRAWGRSVSRRGKAKKKGGIGIHVTKRNPRFFFPNLRRKRIFVPELGRAVTVRVTARALKTMMKNGPYQVLREAGVLR
ncbi:50S ribosomal protein L28 [Candidatus Methylacidithermus pantelleriae]|uniref:50S ribosomal protein L28 n=1 Tax=Candidatus Methylacidithermus pantelleriae TaxID=2744239 RepID=UPI00157BD9ED|nr:50S ribosomal protein L28 [Candidatus Methylacidithermus pantelleriae]